MGHVTTSTVTNRAPRAVAGQRVAEPLDALGARPGDALRMLLVAGERDGNRIRETLRRADLRLHACAEVSRVSEAWRALGRGAFDVVVADLARDRRGPLEALHHLQSVAPGVPVIALLDGAREDSAHALLRGGAQDYVLRGDLDGPALARMVRNACDRQQYLSLLRELSFSDPLTGLYNRRGFEMLAEAQLRMVRRTRRPALLLYADLDHLKRINDEHGHAAGDRALMGVAEALRMGLRRSDLVARTGGDEFVALVFEAGSSESGIVQARVRAALDAAAVARDLPVPLDVSIGLTEVDPGGEDTLAELVARADRDLYRSKRRRRSRPR
jgi:diguanylate cyclase (GGDEF)-like protein